MNLAIKKLGFFLLSTLISITSIAQISKGGKPVSFDTRGLLKNVPTQIMSSIDINALLLEDEINLKDKIGPYRFGAEIPVNFSLVNSGIWEELNDGSRLWRLGINSMGAYSINLIYENFHLPEGATLFLYNKEKSTILGAFTSDNNRPDGVFATNLIAGDHIILEYYEPANVSGLGRLQVATVVHAYHNILPKLDKSNLGGGSGACNINVACSLGDNWANEINAVTRIILGGGLCTGAIVNNTLQDGKGYYLTANHCYAGASNTGSWVFNFNLQSTTCNGSGSSNQSLTGATFRARNAGSDFALVEIDDPIPSSYNPYYAGWRNDNVASSSSVCIHHPSGDIKKISRDQNSPTTGNWQGAAVWEVGAWEEGTTEGGSSGSPLFDENTHQIIGQLFGGGAACIGSNPNNSPDYYGRFSTSWDGNSSSSRLRDWLDPNNDGVTAISGYDPSTPVFVLDAGILSIDNPENGVTLCQDSITPSLTIRNSGSTSLTSATITLNVDGTPYVINWTGNLGSNLTESVTFQTLALNPTSHTMAASISNPNNGIDQNGQNDDNQISFSTLDGNSFFFSLTTDNYGNETSWSLTDQNDQILYGESEDTYGAQQTYNTEFCLEDSNCYTFTIYDEYGDGICCNEGLGSYSIKDEVGNTIATGGNFNYQESQSIGGPNISLSTTIESNNQNNGSATVSISGGIPPYDIVWSPGGASTETIIGLSGGTYTVSVTDANDCETIKTTTVGTNVGLDENEIADLVQVFPNPTKNEFTVSLSESLHAKNLSIRNILGETIINRNIISQEMLEVSLAKYAQGVYYITIEFDNDMWLTKKVILSK